MLTSMIGCQISYIGTARVACTDSDSTGSGISVWAKRLPTIGHLSPYPLLVGSPMGRGKRLRVQGGCFVEGLYGGRRAAADV